MSEETTKIKITDPTEKPRFKILDPKELLERLDKVFILVVGAMLIGFITMLFMVAGLAIDAWRFNSAIYKESQQLKVQGENIKNTVDQQKLMLKSLQKIEGEIEKLTENKK